LIPNRSFVELRVREPRQGLVAFRIAFDRRGAEHARRRAATFPRPFPSKKAPEEETLMAIHLETLEGVIATALNIVKNRPLADLHVRRDYTGDFRIRVLLQSGQRYVITIREER